ncbi:MAG: CYTH domain-containing protein [Brumimicrobium sp.]
MGVEIERKFLVDKTEWEKLKPETGEHIIQGYLQKSPEKTVRIRVKENQGFITVKGKTTGISRKEFEYKIPAEEAREMIESFCTTYIDKVRYKIVLDDFTWEVDEFKSPNSGLILAEVELPHEDTQVILPSWVTKEVSHDPQYFNANMI